MTILSEIQKWAEKLPVWQQHAVAVLYERPTPSADDLEDILAPRVRIVAAPIGIDNSGVRMRRRSGTVRTGIQGQSGGEVVAAGERSGAGRCA